MNQQPNQYHPEPVPASRPRRTRRASVALLAGVLLAGLVAVPGAPAGAQDLADLPRLGFEIDPTQGNVGDIVGAQVNPVDVEEHCVTSIEELEPLYFADSGFTSYAFFDPGPILAEFMDRGPLIGIDVPDAWPLPPFGPPLSPQPPQVDPLYWSWYLYNDQFLERESLEQTAALVMRYFMEGLAGGAGANVGAETIQPLYLEETFVLTFVDPVTQELVGPTSTFDRHTGIGEIEVPEIDPGLWVIAAACVEPVITDESFLAAVEAGAAFMADEGLSPDVNMFNYAPPGEEQGWLIAQVAPIMLLEMVQPQAIGLDFYCVLNEDGFCATPPDPVGLLAELTDEELAEFADLEAGAEGAGAGSDVDAELLAEAVTAAPSFTG